MAIDLARPGPRLFRLHHQRRRPHRDRQDVGQRGLDVGVPGDSEQPAAHGIAGTTSSPSANAAMDSRRSQVAMTTA